MWFFLKTKPNYVWQTAFVAKDTTLTFKQQAEVFLKGSLVLPGI